MTTPYVRIALPGAPGERIPCASEAEAIEVAALARNAHAIEGAEVDVCRASGRIVRGWNRTDGRWKRAL